MAFTIKERAGFEFALESEPEKVYTLPPMDRLSFEEAKLMKKIGEESDIVKQGNLIKGFILAHVPELKGLSDMQFYAIFNAYGLSEGKNDMGESKASQNS